jgi:hypothetical protein
MGVTTQKNITPITNGETIFPRNIPNLNQRLFKGVKILDFSIPKIKNINEIIKDHILISPLSIKGKIDIRKNTIKKTIPKLRFELLLNSVLIIIIILIKILLSNYLY